LITSGIFYFFLNKPKTTENLEKKPVFFLVFVIKFCKLGDFSPSLMCANEVALMDTDEEALVALVGGTDWH
ncbi:unnamed protein product, partial [Staurois parvus]